MKDAANYSPINLIFTIIKTKKNNSCSLNESKIDLATSIKLSTVNDNIYETNDNNIHTFDNVLERDLNCIRVSKNPVLEYYNDDTIRMLECDSSEGSSYVPSNESDISNHHVASISEESIMS